MTEKVEEDDEYPDDFEDYVSEASRPTTVQRARQWLADEQCKELVARTSQAAGKCPFESKIGSIRLPLDQFPRGKGLLRPEVLHADQTCRPSGPPSHRPSAAPTYRPRNPPQHRLNDDPVHRPTETPSYRPTSTPRHRPTQEPRHRPPGPPAHLPADLKSSRNAMKNESPQVPAWTGTACMRALDLELDDGSVTREFATGNKNAALLVLGLPKGGQA